MLKEKEEDATKINKKGVGNEKIKGNAQARRKKKKRKKCKKKGQMIWGSR